MCAKHSLIAAILCGLISAGTARAADTDPPAAPSGPAIAQELKSFQQMATVLMIAAHPDDENTQLITYLARGRCYRMGYLSVTRGDGGQNLLGPEFGEELGLIRTNELLAARNLDHGVQFFTRAIDFGFSKTPVETLKIWDEQEVLSDVVRVIRQFRPDVIVTRFAPDQTNTHGHHTASAILGLAAFKVAGDARVLPDVPPWQPKRIFVNSGGRGGAGAVTIDGGGTDPVLNESFASIANRSRAMHKTQGFGGFAQGGGGGGGGRGGAGGPSPQSFQLLAGDPATTDIMDGIDTTWVRIDSATGAPAGISSGKKIAQLIADAIAKFDASNPSASIPALLEIKRQVSLLPAPRDPIVLEKETQLDRIIADCLGLSIQTVVPHAELTPGEESPVRQTAVIISKVPVSWLGLQIAPVLQPGVPISRDSVLQIPAGTPVSQPYWLRQEPETGMYRVADPAMIGRPLNPPATRFVFQFKVDDQTISLADQAVEIIPSAPAPQVRRLVEVIAPVSMAFPSQVCLFAPGIAKAVDVDVTAHHANAAGSLKLAAPAGWTVTPASRPFTLAGTGDHAAFTFNVTPPASPASARLSAIATIGDQTFSTGRKEIVYDHIPRQLLQPPATIKAVSLDLQTRAKTIGYLPGAGDSVAECIQQMGCTVTPLKTADLTPDNLKKFDAVVLGVRAFNTREDLAPNSDTLKALFDYAAAGGTVVEQYSRPDGPGGTNTRPTTLAPYNMHISALRVTDENAAVKFLAPDSPALNTPNKISDADFANWVQERNIYLPDQFDAHFTPILAMADPGETPPNSSLLIARHGKGYFVYTSLVFFRELPAGNPGAYRLFANLISLGKQ